MTFEQIIILAIGAFMTAVIHAMVCNFQKMHEQQQEEQRERDKTVDDLVEKVEDVAEDFKQIEELHGDIRELSLQLDTFILILRSCNIKLEAAGSVTIDIPLGPDLYT